MVCYTYPCIVTADQLKCLVSVMHNKPWFLNIIIIGHLYSPHKPNKIITVISPLDTFISQHIYIFQTQFIFVVFHLEKNKQDLRSCYQGDAVEQTEAAHNVFNMLQGWRREEQSSVRKQTITCCF